MRKQWKRVRLGPTPDKDFARMYKVIMRFADAIIDDGDVILIIEAKMRPEPGVISQLEEYEKLFKETPEFSDYWDHRIQKVLLTTMEDASLRVTCEEHQVKYVIFKRPWVDDYLRMRFRVGEDVAVP